MKYIQHLFIVLTALAVCACSKDSTSDPDQTPSENEARKAFVARNEIGVYQYNTPLLLFDKATQQLVITPSKRIIRIQSDAGDQYVELTLAAMPELSGGGVKGSFKNCIANVDLPNMEIEELVLLRTDNGSLWLWCEKNQMGMILPWVE